jgi:hypothetical protein
MRPLAAVVRVGEIGESGYILAEIVYGWADTREWETVL